MQPSAQLPCARRQLGPPAPAYLRLVLLPFELLLVAWLFLEPLPWALPFLVRQLLELDPMEAWTDARLSFAQAWRLLLWLKPAFFKPSSNFGLELTATGVIVLKSLADVGTRHLLREVGDAVTKAGTAMA